MCTWLHFSVYPFYVHACYAVHGDLPCYPVEGVKFVLIDLPMDHNAFRRLAQAADIMPNLDVHQSV